MLRNTKDIENYAIGATDGSIGHQVRIAPPYDSTAELNRERESSLYQHYGRPGYWTDAPVIPESGH